MAKSMSPDHREVAGSGASAQETKKIYDLVRKHGFPAGIKTFVVRFGEDSGGERAVWISFVASPDFKDSKDRISELNRFVRDVRSDLLNANLPYWPYLDVVGAANQEPA